MKVGLVGCGQVGRRRAAVVARAREDTLVITADIVLAAAQEVAQQSGCLPVTDWLEVVARDDVDVIIVSTSNEWLAPVAIAALKHKKHVLLEKPMARTLSEGQAVLEAANGLTLVKVGFNHRHHPAVSKAHALVREGAIGELLFGRCRYGHGGRPGYDQEWRGDPELSGGGELLDQGIHVMDLFRWFFGDFQEVCGFTGRYVWTGKGVEDNGFGVFRTDSGQVASLHVSWNQWKNLFSFEVFGTKGYLVIEGLGGSYGPERLAFGRRNAQSGPPQEEIFEFESPDNSWTLEWEEFRSAILEKRQPLGCGRDGLEALRMVCALYEAEHDCRVVTL